MFYLKNFTFKIKMKTKKSLRWALWVYKVINILVLVLFGLFFLMLVYSFIQPNFFQMLIVNDAFEAGFGIGNFRFCTSCTNPDNLYLSDLGIAMKLWLMLRGLIFFVLIFLVLKTVKKILRSIESLSTFYKGNIESFRVLAKYGFWISLLSAFNFFVQGETSVINFTIPFGSIAFALTCLVLSDVFKEGQLLLEDNKSIV